MEGETDTNNNIAINWNNIVGQEARSIDDNADLGKVQGLFEPFIVTERGTINKEKFYIPKSLIKRYTDEILFFDITEQQAKAYCMRTTPPSEYEEKGIVQIISDARSRKEEGAKKEEGVTRTDTQIVSVEGEIQRRRSKTSLSRVDINEEEIANKLKAAVNEFKDLVISGTKVAKQKIKQTQEMLEEEKAKRDAEKISKMGGLASQFTNSFDDILSEIKTKTYEEQEQIYIGFIKLIEQQRDLLIARRDLAAKLKDSIQKPVVGITNDSTTTEKHSLIGEKQQQLGVIKEPELPSSQDPQLPETIAATSAEDESKTKAQIITAAQEEPSEQIIASTANTESQIKKQSVKPSKTSLKTKSPRIKKKGK
ncbi:MAG TPA: hypothetical protein VE643_03455 [Nitrososphaeraceae archaeon]|nr:hypothetical protein [Nitrososphaeraceae archaeon]